MKEIVIISGKGGTGKTSVTAAFATLAKNLVLVDCDVDAADLHLVLTPTILETHEFFGGKTARILQEHCTRCGLCFEVCRFHAISYACRHTDDRPGMVWTIAPVACEGCGVCANFCPRQAIAFEDAMNGYWYRSDTRVGPMVHARLGVAEENSGKLVTLIRREARAIAEAQESELILVDGPPGIGCPVIASLSGADHVVIVTEPTVSGIHDLERVVTLAAHFRVPASVIINKADINRDNAVKIVHYALAHGVCVLGEIPYDPVVTQAQLVCQSIIEFSKSPASESLHTIWARLHQQVMKESGV
ncbi:MAG: cell division inhibitor MinD [bacterium ADurb.Bin429]|nr:MAG: cell division inhibitor MinD [bacterium ADurb.Bin429]